jgi:predicted membrane channel-forming protein YqfA (hemolysin III family)
MRYRLYLSLFAANFVLISLGLFQLIPYNVWLGCLANVVLEYLLLKRAAHYYRIVVFLFLAVLGVLFVKIEFDQVDHQTWLYRSYEAAPFLFALIAYQIHIFGTVRRMRLP